MPRVYQIGDKSTYEGMFAVYSRPRGIWGWLTGWYLVRIGEKYELEELTRGYCVDMLHQNWMLMSISTNGPFAHSFWFMPRHFKVINKARMFRGNLFIW